MPLRLYVGHEMTEDPFLNFIIAICVAGVLGLVWIVSAASIATDCRTLGSFRISDTVYECRLKETK